MDAVEDEARKHNASAITCHSQEAVVGFYLKNGYKKAKQESFIEEGTVHYDMIKYLEY